MIRPLTLVAAIALSVSLASSAAADPPGKWEKINREAGITVFSKTVPGSDLVAVKGKTVIWQPLEKVLSVLMNHKRWDEWVDSMKDSKILKTHSTYDYVIYQSFELPAFVSNRDFVYRGTVESNAEGQVILRMSSCTWKGAPETVGVRAEMINSQYVLTRKGKNQTTVEVEVHADPKGMIPAWIVNSLQKSWPVNTLTGVRDQASRKDVKPFPAPPLPETTKAKVEATSGK